MRVVGILCPTVGTEEKQPSGVLATQLQMPMCKCVHTHIYVHSCVCTYVCMHVCVSACVLCIHVHMYFLEYGRGHVVKYTPLQLRTPPVETDYVLTVHLQNLPFLCF